MASLVTFPSTDKRDQYARELVTRHLANRSLNLISARINASGVNTWQVNGHTVTLSPVDTCDCGDMLNRHPESGCKHIRAARLVAGTPTNVVEFVPRGGWLSQQQQAQRPEWREEV